MLGLGLVGLVVVQLLEDLEYLLRHQLLLDLISFYNIVGGIDWTPYYFLFYIFINFFKRIAWSFY